jgi:hypothetical protein
MTPPDYGGGSLANLAAELEHRLTGTTPGVVLHEHIATRIPDAATYIVMLFDGLGDHQLDHPAAATLRSARTGSIDAVYPTTTSVNLASLATAGPPARHGLIGHQAYLHNRVVNTLKWTNVGGDAVTFDVTSVIPEPNLWERLDSAGIEAITVQSGSFQTSPLSKVLYRGCRFEPAWSYQELIDATVQLATDRRRLIFTYLPNVDVAAHLYGLESADYTEAIQIADSVWSHIAARLPTDALMIGVADHGVLDYPAAAKIKLHRPKELVYHGDPRGVAVRGPESIARSVAESAPATWMPLDRMRAWWGPEPFHPDLPNRLPTGMLVPDPEFVLLPNSMDSRMVGYHGGLDEREVKIPLLVA